MGKCSPEDQTSIVTPVTTLIGALVMMAGGIAAIVLGIEANEAEAGSGNTSINVGVTAITTGFVTAAGSITWMGFKCREVAVRDDSDDDAGSNDTSGGPDAQELETMAGNLDQLEQGLRTDVSKVEELVSSTNSDSSQ